MSYAIFTITLLLYLRVSSFTEKCQFLRMLDFLSECPAAYLTSPGSYHMASIICGLGMLISGYFAFGFWILLIGPIAWIVADQWGKQSGIQIRRKTIMQFIEMADSEDGKNFWIGQLHTPTKQVLSDLRAKTTMQGKKRN